jgi:hypothetical protein
MKAFAIIAAVAATFQLAPANAKEFRTVVSGPCTFLTPTSWLSFSGTPGVIDPPRESKRLIIGVTMPGPVNTALCVKLSPHMPVGTTVELYFIGTVYPTNPGSLAEDNIPGGGIYLIDENDQFLNTVLTGTSAVSFARRPGVFVRKLFPSASAPNANGNAWGSSP